MIKGNEGTTVHTFPFLSFYRHQIPDPYSSEKVAKKSKVHLFLSQKGIDLLEHETMVSAFYTLSLSRSLSHSGWYLFGLVWSLTSCQRAFCPQFLLYQSPLFTVSFCAVLPSSPKIFGYVARHPAADTYHCYLFQSKKFVSPCTFL